MADFFFDFFSVRCVSTSTETRRRDKRKDEVDVEYGGQPMTKVEREAGGWEVICGGSGRGLGVLWCPPPAE